MTNGYDANGNLLYKTDANGTVMGYNYDALNRVTLEYMASSSVGSAGVYNVFAYDTDNEAGTNLVGRLTWTSNYIDTDRHFSYDSMGRLIRSQGASPHQISGYGGPVSFGYDLAGNPVQMTYPDGRVIRQAFDGAGRLQQVNDMTSGTAVPYFTVNSYWPSGSVHTAIFGNGVTEDIELNNRMQPVELSANTPALAATSGQSNLYDRIVNYTSASQPYNNGNIYSIVDNLSANRTTQGFTYDGLNRLQTAARSDGAYNHVYNYDSFGNMLRHDLLKGDLNYSIDGATNRLMLNGNNVDLRYDATGELTHDPLHTYNYFGNGRLRQLDGGSTASYSYYTVGQRSGKVTPAGWTDYIYSGGQPVAEHTSDGNWVDYIYANGQKIAKLTTPAGQTPSQTAMYFLDDHLGTMSVSTDGAGNILWQGDYTPFGQEIVGSATSNSFGYHDNGAPDHYKFTGKERDNESGLDYFGARYYGSTLGRFMTPDWSAKAEPIPYSKLGDPQSLNLYSYVNNSPLSRVDADGHKTLFKMVEDMLGRWYQQATNADERELPDSIQRQRYADSHQSQAAANAVFGAQQQTPKTGRQPDGSYIAPTGPGTEIGNITDPAKPLPPMIGNGQCVTACKHFSGITAPTGSWQEGPGAANNPNLPIGTAIATFGSNGKYPTNGDQNSGIYMGQGKNGSILILDQWPAHPVSGTPAHPPQIREMRFNDGSTLSNSAQAYHVIIVP